MRLYFQYGINSFVVVLLLIFNSSSWANEMFQDCDLPEFRPLREYLQGHSYPPAECLRLGDGDYLFTVMNTGRLGQGLYRYEAVKDQVNFVDGSRRPLIQVLRQIETVDGRYILLSWGNLSEGRYLGGYEILSLPSRPSDEKFDFQLLFLVSEDRESGLCGRKMVGQSIDGKALSVNESEIKMLAGDAEMVTITFPVIEEHCGEGWKKSYEKKFQLIDGKFSSIAN